jgi:hypothetical protein
MATASVSYGTAQTMTVTNLGAIATSSTLVAGWASAAVDNAAGTLSATVSDAAIDVHVGGKITTSGTTTANTQIEVWAYGSYDGTTYTAGISGSEGTVTLTSSEKPMLRLLNVIPNLDTTARTYEFGPLSVAAAYGGAMPRKWGVFVTQSTGTSLAAAGSQEVKFTTVKYVSA